MLQDINKELLIWLNSLLEYDFINSTVLFFCDAPIFFLPIFLISMWTYYSYRKNSNILTELHLTKSLLEKENLLYIFYSVVIWITISLIIQQFVHIDRPEEALKWVWSLLMNHIPDASFPSDHATVWISFLTSLFLAWFKKTWLIFAPIIILMVISRVILWVHWPLDIIAWSLVWIFSSFLTFNYLTKIVIINKLNQFIIKTLSYIKL